MKEVARLKRMATLDRLNKVQGLRDSSPAMEHVDGNGAVQRRGQTPDVAAFFGLQGGEGDGKYGEWDVKMVD